MAGIYLHIPFCRQKCYYCDFYKTVNTSLLPEFLEALLWEAKIRKNYLESPVDTIYFGGGTPSVLGPRQLEKILDTLHRLFPVRSVAELTFEANPDDLTPEYLHALRKAGINRLSIGIQTLEAVLLQKMNRRHTSEQAINAVKMAAEMGFDNISIDLIYGIPGLSAKVWEKGLIKALQLPVQHLSAYHLTYHEGTAFYTWLKKGTLVEVDEEESVRQFESLVDIAREMGFEQYEISNFSRNELYSKHNIAYWLGEKYLGLGPSAHSYNQSSRRWNVSSVAQYIEALNQNKPFFEEENLSQTDRFNEYVLTRIRTKWGLLLPEIEQFFGENRRSYLEKQISKYIESNAIFIQNERVLLTKKGLFISDKIMADLIII